VKNVTRPAIFKWRQTAPELIFCAVPWYLRYSLSFRDVEELLTERGLEADHTTIWRWVQRYGPELEQRLDTSPPLRAPTGTVPQQHPGTRPPRDQTPREGQARVARVPGGVPNDSGL